MKKIIEIYPGVEIGLNAQISEYVVIGKPCKGVKLGTLRTIIGKDAILRTMTIIYAGCKIGNDFQTGDGVKIYWQSEIGNNVSIGTDGYVGHHVKIGDGVRLHTNVFVPEFCVLEDNCWLGPHAVLTNTPHPLCPKAKQCLEKKAFVVIGKRAKIGANATILPGVKIGEMALVGAGAVVVEDVPSRKVVVGNPAKVIKDIDDLRCPYDLIKKPY